MRRYLIVPSDFSPDNLPQDKMEELHINGPNEHNADIVIMENGVVKRPRLPYRRRLADRLGAELIPVESEVVKKKGTETKVFGKEEKLPDLLKGATPLSQFILDRCGWEEGLEIENLVGELVELGWFEMFSDVDSEEVMEKTLGRLTDKELLSKYNDRYYRTPKKLEDVIDLEEGEGYDIEEGPYPVVKLIRSYVSENSPVRKYSIVGEVSDEWGWTTSKDAADFWVDKAEEAGFIRKTGRKKYEEHRAIT